MGIDESKNLSRKLIRKKHQLAKEPPLLSKLTNKPEEGNDNADPDSALRRGIMVTNLKNLIEEANVAKINSNHLKNCSG